MGVTMTVCEDPNGGAEPRDSALDSPHLYERAAEHLLEQLMVRGELSAARVAGLVLSTLPSELADWLESSLARLGWLKADARVPFDVFESGASPAHVFGRRLEFARLAVFGVPGEGVRFDAKRREAIFQQRCGEIMRELRDLESLSFAAARALGHPEVHGDPVLVGMLRVFVSEREAELRARLYLPGMGESDEDSEDTDKERQEISKAPLRQRVRLTLSKLQHEFAAHIAAYAIGGARDAFDHIKELRRRYPAHVDADFVEHCEEQMRTLAQRRDEFREHLTELTQQAVQAMERGDQRTAAWVRRRLDAVHANLPAVLTEERLESLKAALRECGERQDRHEVARQLVAREQAVAGDVKRLGKITHKYYTLLKNSPVDSKTLRQASEEFEQARDDLRGYDDEWLADLMIELDCLLVDMYGPAESQHRAAQQVDKFVDNVREMLQRLRGEIREIDKRRVKAGLG